MTQSSSPLCPSVFMSYPRLSRCFCFSGGQSKRGLAPDRGRPAEHPGGQRGRGAAQPQPPPPSRAAPLPPALASVTSLVPLSRLQPQARGKHCPWAGSRAAQELLQCGAPCRPSVPLLGLLAGTHSNAGLQGTSQPLPPPGQHRSAWPSGVHDPTFSVLSVLAPGSRHAAATTHRELFVFPN